jgi:hypothetical protein
MNDTPKAADADIARELAQAISTRNEAEANLTNAVATGDNKLIADRGRGYVTAAREVGKLCVIIGGVPRFRETDSPPIVEGVPGGPVQPVPSAAIGVGDVERLVTEAIAPLTERIDNICANLDKHLPLVEKGPDEEPVPESADDPARSENEAAPAASPSATEGGAMPGVPPSGAPGAEVPATSAPGLKTPGDAKPQTRA